MAERKDTDALLMDWLYEESDRQSGHGTEEVAAHEGELDSYRRIRESFRELPDEEPPPALTAILLHEAARRAPAGRARAVTASPADEERGLFSWLGRLFGSMVAHPAATAAATLVLVAGVAGSLYVRGQQASEPRADSAARSPAFTTEAEPAADPGYAPGDGQAAAAAEPASEDDLRLRYDKSYPVTLADGESAQLPDEVTRGKGKRKTADKDTEKLELAKKADPSTSTRSPARQRKDTAKVAKNEERTGIANVVSGADQLIELDDSDALSTVQSTGRSAARDERPSSDSKSSAPPPAEQPAGGAAPGKDSGGESANSWARAKHAQLEREARRDECAAAAGTANDIRERAPAYYDQHVAGSDSYERCASRIVAERKRRTARKAKEAAAESADQPAAEPSK